MPRSPDPEHYPYQFTEYVKKVGLEGKSIRVPVAGAIPDDEQMKGEKRALKLRATFWAYIGALKRARKAGDEKWIELANYADQTVCYFDRQACALYFYPRKDAWQGKLLATGGEVDTTGSPMGPGVSPADESLEKLKRQLEEE